MKVKKGLVLLMSMVLAFSIGTVSAVAAQVKINVQVDGKNVKFPDAKPYVEDNRVMIPVRFVSESLGAKVDYHKQLSGKKVNRVVEIVLQSKHISMNVNADKVLVDGKLVMLDVPARVQQERVFVPLRFVSEALGAKVDWNSSKKLVSISTGAIVTKPDPITTPNDDNMYNSNFKWKSGYTDLAKKLFVNNMQVSQGKLTFKVPVGSNAAFLDEKGAITKLIPGKTYSYAIGKGAGSLSLSLVYEGKPEQEAYTIFLNSSDTADLGKLFGQYQDAIVVAGSGSGAPLSEVQKLALQLK